MFTTAGTVNSETYLAVHAALFAVVVEQDVSVVDTAVMVAVGGGLVEAAQGQPEAELGGEAGIALHERAGQRLGRVYGRAGARAHVGKALWERQQVHLLVDRLLRQPPALGQVVLFVVAGA
jgi:hypothetical protein